MQQHGNGENSEEATTEEESEEEHGSAPAAPAAPPLWPAGRTRCKYDEEGAGGCYQCNPKHLARFSHRVAHVRTKASELGWLGPKGPLYRVLTENGVDLEGRETHAQQLAALETQLSSIEAMSHAQELD